MSPRGNVTDNTMNLDSHTKKILPVTVFAIAMAFVESAVVVYLRAIFHPEGFSFPLKALVDYKILVEVLREIATIFMLLAVAYLAGKKFWERFAYFMLSFGVWDIFYYVWLKVMLDWPPSLFAWDVLFLIPLPWIGPVIAPVSVALLMIVFSILIIALSQKGLEFKPTLISHVLALTGIIMVLYSFMYDIEATMHEQMPKPYRYELLLIADTLFIIAFGVSYLKGRKENE